MRPHNNPSQDGWTEAERCPHCGRWIIFDNDMFRRVGLAYQVNWDKVGGFYYGTERKHSLILCKSRKADRELAKEIKAASERIFK